MQPQQRATRLPSCCLRSVASVLASESDRLFFHASGCSIHTGTVGEKEHHLGRHCSSQRPAETGCPNSLVPPKSNHTHCKHSRRKCTHTTTRPQATMASLGYRLSHLKTAITQNLFHRTGKGQHERNQTEHGETRKRGCFPCTQLQKFETMPHPNQSPCGMSSDGKILGPFLHENSASAINRIKKQVMEIS